MASYIVTGIHAAARAGKLQKVQDYIAKGGDVNKPDREHCSPLMWACWGGHVEIVKRLLEEGANPDTFSHQHAGAMHWATWGGHTEIVKLLLEHKVSLDESDEQDGTPLHYAAKKGFVGLAKIIVSAGGTVDVRNVKEMTPLHLACHYNRVEVAKFLILKQSAVGSVDHINRTPLHYACLKSHINSVRLLLEWGAEVMVIDTKGKLPLHLVGQSASQKNRGKSDDIIKLLKSKMPEDDDQGLDGSYHPESGGTLMGAAASVAKNVASHVTPHAADPAPAPTASTSMASAEESSLDGENGTHPTLEASESNIDRSLGPDDSFVHGHDGAADHLNGAATGRGGDDGGGLHSKPTIKADGSSRKSTMTLNFGAAGALNPKGVSPARAFDGTTSTLQSASQGSPDMSFADKQRRKKSTINITMSDGVVSIGEGKSGNETSPTHKRRGSNFGLGVTSAAPAPGTRVKRSPQGSVAGGSSTKGSERDEMEEISNEEVAYEMALEQIIADLDDLEERVENLNVDQKTNEDILLNVLKRVDETEKDLRKMKRSTIAKDFEAKQASAGNERSAIVEQPVAPTLGGTVNNHRPDGWSGAGSMGGGPFASLEEVNELRQAVALKDKELRDIRNKMQDRDADLDTLRKAGRNLRERLEEKDVETRDIMERLAHMEDAIGKDASGSGGCVCIIM